jgi:hypothetical protein
LIELVELEKRQTAGRQREADRLRHYTPRQRRIPRASARAG